MTVRELLECFNIYPDKICFYDELNDIQDTVYIMRLAAEGKKEYDAERYREFVNEYGDRYVYDWSYGYDNMLDLSF